jgi:hypothetical protein
MIAIWFCEPNSRSANPAADPSMITLRTNNGTTQVVSESSIANPKRSAVDHEVFPDSFVSAVTKMRNFLPLPPDCDRRHSKDRLTGYL